MDCRVHLIFAFAMVFVPSCVNSDGLCSSRIHTKYLIGCNFHAHLSLVCLSACLSIRNVNVLWLNGVRFALGKYGTVYTVSKSVVTPDVLCGYLNVTYDVFDA